MATRAQGSGPPRRPGDRPGDGPGLRASDAERDEVIAELRERYAEGRLSHDTFLYRLDEVLHTKQRADLDRQLADLPRRYSGRVRCRAAGWRFRRAIARLLWPGRTPAALILPAPEQHEFTIGREEACDLTLGDVTVSRWHASLQRDGGSWLLSDLGSTNGTRLNGWRVSTPVRVQPGDSVAFGRMIFVLAHRPGLAAVADHAGPDHAGPDYPGPDYPGPDLAGPDAAGPDAAGPDRSGQRRDGPARGTPWGMGTP